MHDLNWTDSGMAVAEASSFGILIRGAGSPGYVGRYVK